MAPLASIALVVTPPPTISAEPSGRRVSVPYVRWNVIGVMACQSGDGCVMSMMYAVAAEGTVGMSGSVDVPAFSTLPGRYITALPPSTAAGSTTVHGWLWRSSTRLTIGYSAVLAPSTGPFRSTKMGGPNRKRRPGEGSRKHGLVFGVSVPCMDAPSV